MKSVLLLIRSLKSGLLAGSLILNQSNFHPPLQAAVVPSPFKVIENIEGDRLTLECQSLPTSVSQSISSPTLSKPLLRRIRLKQTLRFGDTVFMSGVENLLDITALWLLGDESIEWIYGKRSKYIQCGQSIQLTQLQKRLDQLRRVFSDVVPSDEHADSFGVLSFFDVIPKIENNDTLVLLIEPRRIHNIKIVTWCDWNQWAVEHQGTRLINGRKPDTLIRQRLGIVPGDRLPSHATTNAAMDSLWSLGLFRLVSFGVGIEDEPDKLNWIVCVEQKSEVELVYDEAQRIGAQDSTEAVKRAIDKHKEALLLFRQPKTAPREYDRPIEQQMEKYRFMSVSEAKGVILGKRFPTEADCLIKIAANYTLLSEFYQALHYYSQALSVMQQTGDKDGELTLLTELGDIYSTLGDQKNARQFYDQALSVRLNNLKRQQQQTGGTP